MEKRILNYRKYIDELLQKTGADWAAVSREHLIQISFFQHERLIHLIVTVTFAILEIIVIGLCVTAFTPGVGLLSIALLVLLVPYVRHYYILEMKYRRCMFSMINWWKSGMDRGNILVRNMQIAVQYATFYSAERC